MHSGGEPVQTYAYPTRQAAGAHEPAPWASESRAVAPQAAAPPEQAPSEGAMERGQPLTMTREELLRSLEELRALCRDYRALHERIWEDDAPGEEMRQVLARHREAAGREGGPFAALGPAGGLLDYLLGRLQTGRLAFRLPRQGSAEHPPLPTPAAPDLAPLTATLREVLPPLEALAGRVYALAQAAPSIGGVRAQRVLAPSAALFKAIVRQDWADAELVLNHLNMVTTSRENHELVEQIGRLVRSIYDSLNEISQVVPVEALSDVTDEIPDAVDKLHSVIAELEDGVNRNLDLLEALSGQVHRGRTLLDGAQEVLRACDAELESLAVAHPDAGAALQEVRERLAQDAAGALDASAGRLDASHEVYMTLFANQSYQDLTGQTLKKVIAFIEGLQYQLIQVISQDSGIPTADGTVAPHRFPAETGPDAHNRLSQDKVDAMLVELGF